MQCGTWWKTPSVFSSCILLAAQAIPGGIEALMILISNEMPHENTDQNTTQPPYRLTTCFLLQCNIQFNPWTRHTWWICYGVQGFVKLVTECGTKASQIRKISYGKWVKLMRKWVWRLKIHPTLIYSYHSFGRLYKLVLGHLNNQWVWEVISKTCVRVWPCIKTFEGFEKFSRLHLSSFICLLMFWCRGQTLRCVFDK